MAVVAMVVAVAVAAAWSDEAGEDRADVSRSADESPTSPSTADSHLLPLTGGTRRCDTTGVELVGFTPSEAPVANHPEGAGGGEVGDAVQWSEGDQLVEVRIPASTPTDFVGERVERVAIHRLEMFRWRSPPGLGAPVVQYAASGLRGPCNEYMVIVRGSTEEANAELAREVSEAVHFASAMHVVDRLFDAVQGGDRAAALAIGAPALGAARVDELLAVGDRLQAMLEPDVDRPESVGVQLAVTGGVPPPSFALCPFSLEVAGGHVVAETSCDLPPPGG